MINMVLVELFDSEPIENIAYSCGYQNYSHFYRQFVRKNNTSPESFRKQKRIG